MDKKARIIALYLPQYHPIPENDEWWGKGFTEWTNVAKCKPRFRNHYQPKIPTELGFYDLRLPSVRQQQADLAAEAGIEGFCYWHYWFGDGKVILEKIFNEVLASGKPDFPFCLAWANHSWTSKTWTKDNKELPNILIEQKYLGEEDYTKHFYYVLPAFKDKRYITVDDKPFFLIYNPLEFHDVRYFIRLWRKLALKNGLKGIHFVGIASTAMYRSVVTKKYEHVKLNNAAENFQFVLNLGFDAVNSIGLTRANILAQGLLRSYCKEFMKRKIGINILDAIKQEKINKYLYVEEDRWENVYPTLIPNFDRTPRTDKDVIYYESTPEVFKKNIQNCLSYINAKEPEHKIVILKSWNEWGEGNYVEPDIKYGRGYLDALRETIII